MTVLGESKQLRAPSAGWERMRDLKVKKARLEADVEIRRLETEEHLLTARKIATEQEIASTGESEASLRARQVRGRRWGLLFVLAAGIAIASAWWSADWFLSLSWEKALLAVTIFVLPLIGWMALLTFSKEILEHWDLRKIFAGMGLVIILSSTGAIAALGWARMLGVGIQEEQRQAQQFEVENDTAGSASAARRARIERTKRLLNGVAGLAVVFLAIAWAVDQAGNSVPASINVVVQPLATPVLSEYPRTLGPDDVLVVRGKTSYAAGQIAVWLAREGEEAKSYRVNADNNGEFIFVAEKKLGEGAWTLWAEASDARGARSVPTEKVVIAVESRAVLRIGLRALMYLTVTVTVVALVPLLLALLAYSWYRFMRFRRKLRQEVHRAEGVIDKAFDALRKDVRAHVLSLEKAKRRRSLTEEEERMLRQLAQDLERAE